MLSFSEKRAIQKEIKAKYQALESEKGFKAKRELQKGIKELYEKLGSTTPQTIDYTPYREALEQFKLSTKDTLDNDENMQLAKVVDSGLFLYLTDGEMIKIHDEFGDTIAQIMEL